MADKPGNKPPPGKTPAKKPAAKKPSAKTPAKTTAPEQPPADAAPAPEKKAAYKPTGVKSSFVLVTIAGLLWGFMAGVGWAKLQDIYAEGYHTFNNAELPLLLPFLMMFFSLSLYWLIRTAAAQGRQAAGDFIAAGVADLFFLGGRAGQPLRRRLSAR